ncbi:MAG TPA: hypothetical protein VF297_28540 [Pyrinomonadaceae bacterium]
MASRTSKKSSKKGSSKRSSKSSKASAKGGAGRTRPVLVSKSAAMVSLAAVSGGELDRFVEAKEAWSEQLIKPTGLSASAFAARRPPASPAPEDNISGVGIGEKIIGGRHTGVMAVKFLVRVKYADNQIPPSDRLPAQVNGLPTDVEEVGTFRRFEAAVALAATPDPRSLLRPAPPGCSVGFQDPGGTFIMAGTFGALVRRGQRLFILSNNHVLADENGLPVGSPIFQPGFLDAGNPPVTDRIAELSAFARLQPLNTNFVDCAIAEVFDPSLVTNAIIKIGRPSGAVAARDKMVVHKFGRTTGYRVGFIDTTMMDVSVDYSIGRLKFKNQIIIRGLNGQPFSAEGDSGSLIVERDTARAVGLLFAGSASHTIANHIGDVFQALNVRLA